MLEYTSAMLAPRSTYHNTFLEQVLCGLLDRDPGAVLDFAVHISRASALRPAHPCGRRTLEQAICSLLDR